LQRAISKLVPFWDTEYFFIKMAAVRHLEKKLSTRFRTSEMQFALQTPPTTTGKSRCEQDEKHRVCWMRSLKLPTSYFCFLSVKIYQSAEQMSYLTARDLSAISGF